MNTKRVNNKAGRLKPDAAVVTASRGGKEPEAGHWWVYMIRCDDDSLYTGVSTDPARRFQEHLQHPRGARYFNGRQPVAIVYTESGHSRSSACQREAAIKKLSRADKLRLISAPPASQVRKQPR